MEKIVNLKDETMRKVKELIQGKVAVLFGRPLVGKTVFALKLAREFLNPILLKIDTNYDSSWAKEFVGEKLEIREIRNARQLLKTLDNIPEREDVLVIIDSITSLADEFLLEGETFFSPRRNVELTNFYNIVLRKLAKLKDYRITSLIVAHEKIMDFVTREVGPRMNIVALRHADIVLHLVEEEGKRKVKIWKKREMITYDKAKFYLEI